MRIKRDEILAPGGAVYMRRWYLETLLFSLRIHHILTEDPDDGCVHDHPWSFLSLILRGWYRELRVGSAAFPCVGRRNEHSIAFRRAESLHRIVEVSPGGAWTLVMTGPKRRSWGYVDEGGWIHWRTRAEIRFGSADNAYR